MNAPGDLWLFGYGSIIWRTEFPYLARRAARLPGFVRRFWQGSHDHRGTHDAPGRVVTLIRDTSGFCDGAAYLIASENREAVLDALDYREKNGYQRFRVNLLLAEEERLPSLPEAECVLTPGLAYIAPQGNHAFLGDAPLSEIIEQVRRSRGPSGTNLDYAKRLAESVRFLGGIDSHVEAVRQGLDRP